MTFRKCQKLNLVQWEVRVGLLFFWGGGNFTLPQCKIGLRSFNPFFLPMDRTIFRPPRLSRPLLIYLTKIFHPPGLLNAPSSCFVPKSKWSWSKRGINKWARTQNLMNTNYRLQVCSEISDVEKINLKSQIYNSLFKVFTCMSYQHILIK